MTVALDRALPAADAGVMADGKPVDPDPEVPQRARRRSFTAKYKLEVLAAYEAAEPGEKGAILRREGLYSSHIVEWRRAARAGGPARGGAGRAGQAARRKAPGSAGRAGRPPSQGEGAAGAGAGQGPLRDGRAGKTAGALGAALRERGHRDDVTAAADRAVAELAP